jgi:hypothetical protein
MATTVPDSAKGAVKDRSTRVLARFTGAPSVTTEKYDECIKRLKGSESQWPPDGLAYHVAFSSQLPGQRDLGFSGAVRRVREASAAGIEGRWNRARGRA